MFVILIAFLSPFFNALASIIECRLLNKFFKHPATMIFYVSLMSFVFLPVLLFFGTPTAVSPTAFCCYLILAAIDVSYLWPYYKAMKEMDTSVVTALLSLGQITIPLLTWLFLNEKLHTSQYIGFFIIVCSSVILSINNFRMPKLNHAFYYMVIVSFIRAVYVVLEKYVLTIDDNWINLMFYTNILTVLLPFSLLFHKKMRKRIRKCLPPYINNWKLFSVNEFCCFLGMASTVFALSRLSAVTSASINASSPIFLLGISLFLSKFFHICLYESLTPKILLKKLVCFSGIIGGIILVAQ